MSKAERLINSLDTARCNQNWHDVPGLLRKINKHAPDRKCLAHTSRAECQIVEHIKKTSSTGSPTGAQDERQLRELVPILQSAIEEEQTYLQEKFQAQVCLSWLHWELSEPAEAAAQVPQDLDRTLDWLSNHGQTISAWTEVCILKGAYLKGAAQALASEKDDALRTLKSIFSSAANSESRDTSNPQFLYWSEQLLAKSGMLAYELVISQLPNVDESITEFGLRSFRHWASHSNVKSSDPASSSEFIAPTSYPNALLWKTYYDFLSTVVQDGISYPSSVESRSKRVQLSTEFRRLEAICENVMLRNTKFPKANIVNTEVERWVEQVIRNWEVFCGPEWCDDDFGEGGQDAVSRNVLDILYRAATKTFHSTLILRRLFHVHAALAEFELAIHALDTYIHLVTSAKERAEQSGRKIDDTEDDKIFISTLSEGIIVLCCFGSREVGDKLKEVTDILDVALANLPENLNVEEKVSHFNGNYNSSWSIPFAYRALGIGRATWARWTPVNESRSEIQAEAIFALEKSLEIEASQGLNLATAFALALLRAETRDLDGAIDLIRTALSSSNTRDNQSQRDIHSAIYCERDMVPLWHLLALLLSAKEDFKTATNACDAAFDIVTNDQSLHKRGSNRSLRSFQENKGDALQSLSNERLSFSSPGMEPRERESMVELRMTQLALLDIFQGPETALNHSGELLGLFGQLFTGIEPGDIDTKDRSEHLIPSKASTGTVRTLRGGIFGWKRSQNQRKQERENGVHDDTSRTVSTSSSRELAITAPAIRVTDNEQNISMEKLAIGPGQGSLRVNKKSAHKLHRGEGSFKKVIRGHSREKSAAMSLFETNGQDAQLSTDNTQLMRNKGKTSKGENAPPTMRGESISARQTLPSVPHNMKHKKEPAPAGHSKQPPRQDVRLPASSRFDSPTKALTRFPRMKAEKHALGLLVKIWLFIASLYRRASLLDDALEACKEASTQATRIEALIAGLESSARAFASEGWGGTKSMDEIWGDIHAERGYILQSQSQPYEAMKFYEEALIYSPNHPQATVGLSNLLLDIYEQKLPAEDPSLVTELSDFTLDAKKQESSNEYKHDNRPDAKTQDNTPDALNRIASRDRAYGLLSALTKLGTSWDDSEAWFALSRAYEQGEQIEKAKEVLRWCIDLEDGRPSRHWWNVGSGGYVL